ncbi:unknown protein [Microcystis aeruginosa NIES-843]|uniref:Uncharacterized protein n=1 Tax=Microcystis aeruginosa (strain NIES-843 / IAM M-2473) TaxID=449447 RepID=B0JV43_MICAN|nr:unknown protein [Microcystis aeruginosa NIES-843]
MGVKNCRIPPPIGTPLIKGGRGDQTPLIKGRSPRLSAPPLSRVDPPAYRHPPYQGGQGGSKTISIFNLIETTYLHCNKSLTRS